MMRLLLSAQGSFGIQSAAKWLRLDWKVSVSNIFGQFWAQEWNSIPKCPCCFEGSGQFSSYINIFWPPKYMWWGEFQLSEGEQHTAPTHSLPWTRHWQCISGHAKQRDCGIRAPTLAIPHWEKSWEGISPLRPPQKKKIIGIFFSNFFHMLLDFTSFWVILLMLNCHLLMHRASTTSLYISSSNLCSFPVCPRSLYRLELSQFPIKIWKSPQKTQNYNPSVNTAVYGTK